MLEFKKVIRKADSLLGGLLEDHTTEIEKAYLKLEESEPLKLTMSVSLKGTIEEVELNANLSFVENRVKDCALAKVSGQMEIGEKA